MPDGVGSAGLTPDATNGRAQPVRGVSYQFERLIDLLCYDDLARITREHWAAIALNRRDVPLVVDWEAYLSAERAGTWRAFTARRDGRLIGYIAFNFQHPVRYRTTLYIQEDTIWIIPEVGPMARALIWRGLWKAALEALAMQAPKPAVVYGKVRLTGPDVRLLRNTMGKRMGAGRVLFMAVAKLLSGLGFEPVEIVLCKVLK